MWNQNTLKGPFGLGTPLASEEEFGDMAREKGWTCGAKLGGRSAAADQEFKQQTKKRSRPSVSPLHHHAECEISG